MRAAVVHGSGKEARMEIEEVEVPTPKPDEVLIRVDAAGLNRPDILQVCCKNLLLSSQ